ncbi:MAG: pentapeptide repeat-containing protein, partial [Cyanobacteria bacterium]|nr:pentapeptide repeat-containing protein [Cyanobacteriota bacterium]
MTNQSSQAGKSGSQLRVPKLKGKTVAFVGDLGRYNASTYFSAAVRQEGGEVIVDLDEAVPDYLVIGAGRGGGTPGQAKVVLKKHPHVQAMDCISFCTFLLPTPIELNELIKSGEMGKPLDDLKHGTSWDLLDIYVEVLGGIIDLAGQSFRGCNLEGAKLGVATINGADLSEANLSGARLPAVLNAQFENSDITYAHLNGAERCSFRGANLSYSWFYDVHQWGTNYDYIDCDFTGATFLEAHGLRVNISGCLFQNAHLQDASFEESNFSGADFSGANLTKAKLRQSNLSNAKLTSSICYQTDFRDVSLVNADLRDADMRDAILTGADLTGANIDGADFQGAIITDVKTCDLDVSKAKNFKEQAKRSPGR